MNETDRDRRMDEVERRLREIEQHLLDVDDIQRKRATPTVRARHEETLKIFRTKKKHTW